MRGRVVSLPETWALNEVGPDFRIVNHCLGEIDHQLLRPGHALAMNLTQVSGPG